MGSNVELGGLSYLTVRHVTVTSTGPVRLDTVPLAGRNGLEILASTGNTGVLFVAASSSVTSTSGRPVSENTGPVYFGLSTRAQVWCVAGSGSQSAVVSEIG